MPWGLLTHKLKNMQTTKTAPANQVQIGAQAQAQARARLYFPRGLTQPQESFRFSMDALLLSSFVKTKKNSHLLDIGTGCGVIALGLLLSNPEITALGLDIDEDLIASAVKNAAMLGFENNFSAQKGDVKTIRALLQAETFDIVVTNPPYRRVNQGRLPKPHLRKNALFEGTGDLDSFIAGAAFALKNGGAFYCIYPAERLAELFLSLKHHRLEPKTMLPLQALASKNLELVLLKATKNGKAGLKIKKPLLLYKKEGENVRLTQQALAFCPWLKCNAK